MQLFNLFPETVKKTSVFKIISLSLSLSLFLLPALVIE